jgi:hypothetical protein
MGTKGRDIAFWLFVLTGTGAALLRSKPFFWAALVFALLFFYHFLVERPRAIRESREKGLRMVVLVPLCPLFTRLLTGGKIKGKWERAYEIHAPANPADPESFIKSLERDLTFIKEFYPRPALYLWETSVPIPGSIRRLIREREKEGKAFWRKGPWPVPKAPLHGFKRREKRHVRRGAFLLD